MKSRRKAREYALQAIFQCDALNEWNAQSVDRYFSVFLKDLSPASEEEGGNVSFCKKLIGGVIENRSFIDQQMEAASTRWSVARMSRVDRNIIRLGTFEIAFCEDIPFTVSINEAIEIAKQYGSQDSPMFVNGVLDNIANVLSKDQTRAAPSAKVKPVKIASAGSRG